MSATSGKRRGRGDDAIYWDKSKSSYIGAVSLGYTAAGNRRRRKVYGKTKAEVRDGLKELRAEIETGVTSSARYTVTDAVRNGSTSDSRAATRARWTSAGRSPKTTSCPRSVRPSCAT
ncbi:MAG: hypothetical protein ACRDRQ_20790 [Pseudonocardiaceae bacterium]